MNDALAEITTICFDGDGTLWVFEEARDAALAVVVEQLHAAWPTDEAHAIGADDLQRLRDEVADEWWGKGPSLADIRRMGFERLAQQLGADGELAAHLTETYFTHKNAAIRAYPDTLPALDALRGRFRIGLLTNGNTDPDLVGVGEYLEFRVSAEDLGMEKPDPAIFHHMLGVAGAEPHHVLYVGDSIKNDVQGAAGVGMPSAFLDRDGRYSHEESGATVYLTTLTELPAYFL